MKLEAEISSIKVLQQQIVELQHQTEDDPVRFAKRLSDALKEFQRSLTTLRTAGQSLLRRPQEEMELFSGGGEMGALMRAFDWAASPLGSVSQWPQSLRSAVDICLHCSFPTAVCWGPELFWLYNDNYTSILGAKHPSVLGRPLREVFPEIWSIIEPMFQRVLDTGQATLGIDFMLPLERHGYIEECYFNFSYSPIRDDDGQVGGVFIPVAETTEKVIGERRLRTLRDLAARSFEAKEVEAACRTAAETLATNPHDLPFALLYLVDGARQQARLVSTAGIAAGTQASPYAVALENLGEAPQDWPLAEVARTGKVKLVENLGQRFGLLPSGAWPTPPHAALVLPITLPGQALPSAFLVAAISPRKALNADYRTFYDLVAQQVATSLAGASALEEERKRAAALAELDRAKTAFFSNVSHEFRTPLTLMLGPLEELLVQRSGTSVVDRAEIELVYRNGLRLLKLVNTLLDFARIEAGRVQAVYEATDLAQLTTELASVFRSACERAGLRLTVDCSPLPEPVYVDREMWEKIVLNLLSNAFKFTFVGEIKVRLAAYDAQIKLRVSDTGVGIPAAELPHLFERFHQVQGARGRTQEGTGIGLALVQELVKLHGGTVQAESVKGQGSTFTVILPRGSAHLPANRLGASRTLVSSAVGARTYVEEALRWLPEDVQSGDASLEVSAAALPHGASSLTVSSRPRARILLADDNVDMRQYLRRLLSAQYEVEVVADGVAALTAARRRPPDLVLADVMMPRLDGFGLLQALRTDPRTNTVPVVLLSARAGEESRVEGLAAGADDYIIKPFSARELLARVNAHLEMAWLRQEAARREHALRQEAEKAREQVSHILESITDGCVVLDPEWRISSMNAAAERFVNQAREEILGKNYWEAFPTVRGTVTETELRRAMAERMPVEFESLYAPLQKWFEARVYPLENGGLSGFFRDITERKQAAVELQRSNDELRQFAYIVSHDLQEPLRMISSYVNLLARRYQGKLDASADDYIAFAVDGAQRMQQMITALLTYTRVGGQSWKVAAVNCEALIARVLMDLQMAIKESNATITHDPLPTVQGDEIQLAQVLQNLISNALKFRKDTPPHIHISAQREEGHWRFSVRDNGIGIDPGQVGRLFQVFQRLHTRQEYPGTGIGLAICKKIIERHGGRIWIDSLPAQGATVYFTIGSNFEEEK